MPDSSKSDKYSGATDMDIPFGYPTMRVPGARIDWAQFTRFNMKPKDRRPTKRKYLPRLSVGIVG